MFLANVSTGIPMIRIWKVAAIAALVAIPLIILSTKKPPEKKYVPESGDSNDIFDRELSAE
jgi:hypothetical protein